MCAGREVNWVAFPSSYTSEALNSAYQWLIQAVIVRTSVSAYTS